jgi:hypothetical protein
MNGKMVYIGDLDRAAVLAALYNAAHPQGLSFFHYDPKPMTVEEAREILNKHARGGELYIDHLYGRVMKVRISEKEDYIDPRLYDRDHGEGAAELVIESLRKTGDVNNPLIQALHKLGTAVALEIVEHYINNPPETFVEEKEGMAVIHLGLPPELIEPLKEVIRKIKGGE